MGEGVGGGGGGEEWGGGVGGGRRCHLELFEGGKKFPISPPTHDWYEESPSFFEECPSY